MTKITTNKNNKILISYTLETQNMQYFIHDE